MPKKVIVDILMLICMILEFSRGYMQPVFHEIIGILFFVLVLIHIRFNRMYFKLLFKGKYNWQRSIMAVINRGFLIIFLCCIIFGILSSQNLLSGLNIQSMMVLKLHKIFGYICLLFTGFHLGINIGGLVKRINKYDFYILSALIVVYGVYSRIKLDIRKHITGEYGFSFIGGNIVINIVRYIGIVIMIAVIVNYIYDFSRKINTK